MPTDRRTLQKGDRCRISEADIEGTVSYTDHSTVVDVRTDDDQMTYSLPPILVDWLPPVDEPELPIGACVRNADDADDGRRWWYLPASDSDSPFINVIRVGDTKTYREYLRRDQLPARIEIVEATHADT